MIYGTLQVAMEYANRECIEEWLQLFLRGDGHNVTLADGLLLEPRQYWGPVEIELKLLDEIQSGAPEYLTRDNDIAYRHPGKRWTASSGNVQAVRNFQSMGGVLENP